MLQLIWNKFQFETLVAYGVLNLIIKFGNGMETLGRSKTRRLVSIKYRLALIN
ncbi:MAG: hypothetical protein ACJASQ_003112 [Crocinitomicaceae bacterium]|jgi:hypothetical protein